MRPHFFPRLNLKAQLPDHSERRSVRETERATTRIIVTVIVISLFVIKLLFNRLLSSHHPNFSHLLLTYVFLSLLEEETAHELLVVFLAPDVPE